jgi:hypothetical protein
MQSFKNVFFLQIGKNKNYKVFYNVKILLKITKKVKIKFHCVKTTQY